MLGLVKYSEDLDKAVNDWDGILSAPSKENRKVPEGIRVMKNGFLEHVISRSHAATPGLWFLPVVLYGLIVGYTDPAAEPWITTGLFLLGILNWTLAEYLLHRWLFHRVPKHTFKSKLQQFLIHGYHHEFPNDKWRLVAPPFLSWPIAVVVVALYYPTLGHPYWWPTFAGTAVGYLAYDWIHYYTHHFRPKTKLGQFLRRYHMEHHYKDQETHFGISSPLWDLVFRTYSRPVDREFPDEIGYDKLEAEEAAAERKETAA